MPAAFPALCPVERSYAAGAFPTRRFSSVSGATTTRLYGSKGSGDTLSLRFATTDAEARSIVAAYQAVRGDFDYVTLPAAIWDGMTGSFQTVVPTYLRWRFNGPPDVRSVFPGRSEVSVSLVGLLEA